MSDEDANFERIVAYARETNPFYAEWLRESVPILPRRVFQENNDLILNGHAVTGYTSGSTGEPVRVSMSPARQRLVFDLSTRYKNWLGGPMATSQVVHRRGSLAPSVLNVTAPLEKQIDWLKQRYHHASVVAMLTHPTNAVLLAQAILEGGHDFGFMLRVGLIGESIDPNDRPLLQRAFPNALIWSNYSSVEFGLIAGQCPFKPNYHHVMSDCFRVEIIDDEDQPCADGEIGRIILTDYFNDQSPFIRYDIGDLGGIGKCPCDRISFPAFSTLIGKVRGTLKNRAGQRVIFFDLSVGLRDLPGMRQYQIVQEELERFIVRLVIDRPREKEIAALFEAQFGYRPQLTFEYHDFLEREPSGKFHSSICRI